MWMHLLDRPDDPQPRQRIQLLDFQGFPSDRWTRVKAVVSEDRNQELWEVIDDQGRERIITAAAPHEWLEVEVP